jgi:hypothetical protein
VKKQEEKKMKKNNSKSEKPRKSNRSGAKTGVSKEEPVIHHHYYYDTPPPPKPKKSSSKPTIAGALLIITAIIGIIGGFLIIAGGFFVGGIDEGNFDFFDLEDKGDITGRVTYLNGTGVEAVNVTVVGTELTTQTDSDGFYIIYEAPIGNQEIRVEHEGYNTYIKKVVISSSEVDFTMEDENYESGNEFDFTITEGDEVIERGEYPPWGLISGLIYTCAALMVIFSIVSLIGGISAIQRKRFPLAAIGALLGILTLIGAIFSLIALFILIISKDEFQRGE